MKICLNHLLKKKSGIISSISNEVVCPLCMERASSKKMESKEISLEKEIKDQEKMTTYYSNLQERLFSLGVFPGIKITMIGESPLKDPILVEVDKRILSLRKSEAHLITVEV